MITYAVNNLDKKQDADFAETYYFWYDILMVHQI
jgi:hypothetical protein